jgi:hypothetical protein
MALVPNYRRNKFPGTSGTFAKLPPLKFENPLSNLDSYRAVGSKNKIRTGVILAFFRLKS